MNSNLFFTKFVLNYYNYLEMDCISFCTARCIYLQFIIVNTGRCKYLQFIIVNTGRCLISFCTARCAPCTVQSTRARSLCSGLTCFRHTCSSASLALQPHLLFSLTCSSASLAIKTFVLLSLLLSMLICYLKLVTIRIRCYQNQLFSK